MTDGPCLICDRLAAIRAGANRFHVAELDTGHVVLGDFQFWTGYTLFLCKHHVAELHLLAPAVRGRFLEEMSLVAEAVFRAFRPRKLNYELLGNAEPHLHWHLFPRHADDPAPTRPVWAVGESVRRAESARPSDERLAQLKGGLAAELQRVCRTRGRTAGM